jgi:MinD-like ATPase involved in chromosome partitioning or flagellar assembly
MQGYVCSHCETLGALFPEASSAATAAALQIPYLGGIPFDPQLALALDQGRPFVLNAAGTRAGQAFTDLAVTVQQFLNKSRIP